MKFLNVLMSETLTMPDLSRLKSLQFQRNRVKRLQLVVRPGARLPKLTQLFFSLPPRTVALSPMERIAVLSDLVENCPVYFAVTSCACTSATDGLQVHMMGKHKRPDQPQNQRIMWLIRVERRASL